MYNLKITNNRWYDVRLLDGRVLHLEPPSMAILRHLEQLDGSVDDMAAGVSEVLSKNRRGIKISKEEILKTLTLDECQAMLDGYMSWISGEKKSDPN